MFTKLKSHLISGGEIEPIDLRLISPSPWQLREDVGDIESLCASIERHGLLQPIIVRPRDGRFSIVAGHRRFEAFRQLRKRHISSIVVDVDDKTAYELALVENLQRGTMNPVEEARAFQEYVTTFGWGGVTDLAHRIGMSEEYVSHRIRLLTLPTSVLELVCSRELNFSKARELVWAKDPHHQTLIAKKAVSENLSSREIRALALSGAFLDQAPRHRKDDVPDRDRVTLRRAVVTLKVALIRLDSLLSAETSKEAHSKLMDVRVTVHGLIDQLVTTSS